MIKNKLYKLQKLIQLKNWKGLNEKSLNVFKCVQDLIPGKKSEIIKLHWKGNDNETNKRWLERYSTGYRN